MANTFVRHPFDEILDRENKEIADEARYESSLEQARLAEADQDGEELGEAFIADSDSSNAFTKLSRYETTIERGMGRAMHELQRLQAARAGQAVHPPVVLDLDIDVSSDQG